MTNRNKAFIYRNTPESNAPSFQYLVVEQEDNTWDLPEIEGSGRPQLNAEGHDFYGHYLNDAPGYTQEDPFFWVSYRGLNSVLEFKGEGQKSAAQKLPTLLQDTHADHHPLTLSDQQYSLVMAKPDAMEKGLDTAIEKALIQDGLTILDIDQRDSLTEADVERIWVPSTKWNPPQEPSEWWRATVRYMTEGPVKAYLVGGHNATERANGIKAGIRSVFDVDPHDNSKDRSVDQQVRSLMHASDRTEELARNVSVFWDNVAINEMMRGYFRRTR
jgi:nucleoside diphosphate kinase